MVLTRDECDRVMQTPTQQSVTQRVCEIPKDFHSGGNKSVYRLLKESGYFENRDVLTREAVAEYLRTHPKLIVAWKQYSEDKRTSRGWYFTTDESDVEVGYFHARRGFSGVQRYGSRAEACTEYILKEAAEISRGLSGSVLVAVAVLLVLGFVFMVYKSLH
jgi:hypothetical protein